MEPPLPGAGSSFWVCGASLTWGRFIIPVLCGRPFPSDCGVEGEADGIASRTGRRLRSVLPYIPGVVLRGGYGKSVRKSWPREVVGNGAWRKRGRARDESAEQRRGKTCGVRCCRSDAIQPHNYWLLRNPDKASGRNGVRGYFPSGFSARHAWSRKTCDHGEKCIMSQWGRNLSSSCLFVRHILPVMGPMCVCRNSFGGAPHFASGVLCATSVRAEKPRLVTGRIAVTAFCAACFPAILPQGHGSRIFRADPGNPAGRVPTYAPTVSSLRDRIRFTFGKGTLPRQSDPALRLAAIRVR